MEYLPLLVVMCCLTFGYVIRKIRKSQMQIEDAVFWIGFTIFLLVLGLLPGVTKLISKWIGIESPSNFIFLVIIFILIIKLFLMSIHLSQLESKLKELTQKIALKNYEKDQNEKE